MNISDSLLFAKFSAKRDVIFRFILCVALLMQSTATFAFETDQYNLPPQPLADIGDEVTQYVEENLRKAIDKINAEIYERRLCIENNPGKPKRVKCYSAEKEIAKLQFLRSEAAVAREVYNQLGAGNIAFTKSGTWLESHDFRAQPARYKTDYKNSIFLIIPTNYLTISKTINIYGAQFGTDKMAHFFQQGYAYYKKYNNGLIQGLAPAKAAKKAIRWGQMTERTYYGTLVSGVYSNADLCANYVGMKFYRGLTRQIKIGDYSKPAVFVLEDGIWKFNEKINIRENLIKPFVSDHFNEAFNPSIFNIGLRSYVRLTVKKHSCEQWLKLDPNLSREYLITKLNAVKLWYGEDYGFTDSKNFVTIANTCFTEKN